MKYIIFIFAIMMTSCTSLDIARTQAASVADESLALGHRLSYESSSVGAIVRKYGRLAEDFNHWISFCWGDNFKTLKRVEHVN